MNLSRNDIESNSTVLNCKVCGGKGFIFKASKTPIPTKNPKRTVTFSDAVLCHCKRNELVEISSPYFNPTNTGTISDELAKKTAKTLSIKKNYKFFGGVEKFLKLCKAVFVHYRQDANMLFYIGNGIEIVTEYYLPNPDGIERSIQDLIRNRALVVIMFTTSVSNKAVAPVIQELIMGRKMAGKATWIWVPEHVEDTAEYSEELKPLLNGFIARDFGKVASQASNNLMR